MKRCMHCGARVSSDIPWEDSPFYNAGRIVIRVPGGMDRKLSRVGLGESTFQWDQHPAVIQMDGQNIEIAWGRDNISCLCGVCHQELVRLIGNFFEKIVVLLNKDKIECIFKEPS